MQFGSGRPDVFSKNRTTVKCMFLVRRRYNAVNLFFRNPHKRHPLVQIFSFDHSMTDEFYDIYAYDYDVYVYKHLEYMVINSVWSCIKQRKAKPVPSVNMDWVVYNRPNSQISRCTYPISQITPPWNI